MRPREQDEPRCVENSLIGKCSLGRESKPDLHVYMSFDALPLIYQEEQLLESDLDSLLLQFYLDFL